MSRNKFDVLKKKIMYKFDTHISKGIQSQFVLLFAVIMAIVLLFGLFVKLVSPEYSVGRALWESLMHIIDQGTICGDDTDNKLRVITMLIVTVLGMAFTGTTVGIINNAISEKLDMLRKGHSQIIEKQHTVVIGFNDSIFTILKELEESNENWKGNRTIVVIDEMPKEDMEAIMKQHEQVDGKPKKTFFRRKSEKLSTTVIFRSGNITNEKIYETVSIENARSVIINKDDDFDIVKIILSLVVYLKKKGAYITSAENKNGNIPTIVTLMHEKENLSAAAIAAEVFSESGKTNQNKFLSLYFEDILAHIFAHVCRQPGLSWVLSELFHYENSEIYIEDTDKNGKNLTEVFEGKTFTEISQMLQNSVAIGLARPQNSGNSGSASGFLKKELLLNPSPDEIFRKGDSLIHISRDDNCIELHENVSDFTEVGTSAEKSSAEKQKYHFLIFGWSIPLPDLISNIADYVPYGSTMEILSRHNSDDTSAGIVCPYRKMNKSKHSVKTIAQSDNLEITLKDIDPYDWKSAKEYLDSIDWSSENPERPTNIVIMCQDGIEKTEADEKVSVLLLNLREYLKFRGLREAVDITTEMNLPENQRLLSYTSSNDFIVGSEIANRIMVQVSNTPDVLNVFTELLDAEGSEIYLRHFDDYVDTDKPFNFRFIQRLSRERGKKSENDCEIPLGWIKLGYDGIPPVVSLNPTEQAKNEIFDFSKTGEDDSNYRVIVLAKQ